MPFGIKLRRTRRYILSQKNSFLMRVQLLDNSDMECTLTLESTGRDCLDAVANKLQLTETLYFGLRYLNKQMKIRWVELDKPLKRQIDKYAHDAILYFGVMFYVADVNRLHHEITRYHYYLQVKSNVIYGACRCNEHEAIELGSYLLQAEFGNHDPERHTVEFLENYTILPEHLAEEHGKYIELLEQVILLHQKHRGLSPSDAEYNYILKSMHLVGFSQDSFAAKNSFGHGIQIGTSFAGIVITTSQKEAAVCHEWPTVENISYTKNVLTFEIPRSNDANVPPIQFSLEDSDTAKYVGKMCCAKKHFFVTSQEDSDINREFSKSNQIRRHPTLRKRNGDSDTDEVKSVTSIQVKAATTCGSADNIEWSAPSNDHSPYFSSQSSLDHDYVSQNSLNKTGIPNDINAINPMMVTGSMYSSPSVHSLTHSHLGGASRAASNISINSTNDCRPLPPYRPSPEYNMAVLRQHRRLSTQFDALGITSNSPTSLAAQNSINIHPQVRQRPHSMIYSQRELQTSNPTAINQPPSRRQSSVLNYRRSLQSDSSILDSNPTEVDKLKRVNLLMKDRNVDDSKLTGSTPALVEPLYQQRMQALHFTKPPAPYASTPDLNYRKTNAISHRSVVDKNNSNFSRRHPHLQLPVLSTLNSYTETNNGDPENSITNKTVNPTTEYYQEVHSQTSSLDPVENKQAAEENVQNYLNFVKTYQNNQMLEPQINENTTETNNIWIPSIDRDEDNVSSLRSPSQSIRVSNIQQNSQSVFNNDFAEERSFVTDEHANHQHSDRRDILPSNENVDVVHQNSEYYPQIFNNNQDETATTPPEALYPSKCFKGARQSTIKRMTPRHPQNFESNSPASRDYDERVQQLENELKGGNLMSEYDSVPRNTGPLVEGDQKRDRHPEIRPYVSSCITIQPSLTNTRGYINASRVGTQVCGKDFQYIACQTPSRGYEVDFWDMIWNEQISIIVLLAQEKEPGKSGCSRYWPSGKDNGNIPCVIYGEYKIITRLEDAKTSTCLTRNLIVEKRNSKRAVWIFQYSGWPDTGVPTHADDFIAFMDIFQSIRRQGLHDYRLSSDMTDYNSNRPIVVQCSTGSGRTGVFILSEILLYTLEHSKDYQANLSVPAMLYHFRKQRMCFVQYFSQYKFIYESLICFLRKSRLI